MSDKLHPLAPHHLQVFIAGPGESDVLFTVMAVVLVAVVLIIGNLYFQLHSLPERVAHRANRVQLEVVAVLCLLALFTHNHLFWIAGLLLAFVRIPDFSTPLARMADALERAERAERGERGGATGTPEATGKATGGQAAGERV